MIAHSPFRSSFARSSKVAVSVLLWGALSCTGPSADPPAGTTAGTAIGSVSPEQVAAVDAIFADWSSSELPGCAVGVAQDGSTVLERAYGMADLEHGIPNTPRTIFEAGSVSKQFTAAAVILLALEGQLSLDDPVRTYIPELPDYGVPLTIRHMMTHTSGLRDWGSVAGISGWGRESRTHTHDHVVDIVSRQSALNFEPGHEYSYSNTGFNLQAVIVSRVSGMSFAEFSKQRIFEPLGMTSTQWRDDYRRIVPGRSSAYNVNGNGEVRINRPIENVHGNGGLLTTVGDLLIWNESLEDGRLAGPEFLEMIHTRGRLNDGREIHYAGGLQFGDLGGVPSISHTGSTAGYRAFLARYPDQRLSVAMLCNASNVSTGGSGTRIARVFLGDAVQEEAAADPPEGIDLPVTELEAKAGLYAEVESGERMRLIVEDGVLRMEGRTPLVPLSATEFAVGGSGRTLTFEDGASSPRIRATGADGYPDGGYEPVEAFEATAASLQPYAGEYYSADAETTLALSVEGGRLVAHRRPNRDMPLAPLYQDAFNAPGLGLMRFYRDASGRITELGTRQGRVYDMRFQRVR